MTTTLDLTALHLDTGSHPDRSNGLCLLEAVAWWAAMSTTTLIETWRAVPGFPMYEVTAEGRVRSLWRRSPLVMRPTVNRDGYLVLGLRRDGRQRRRKAKATGAAR